MDTKILEYVIAIAEEKSLSKAAERLYLSQPALSQRLKSWKTSLEPRCFCGKKWTFHHRCRENLYQWGTFYPADQAGSLKKISSMSRSNKNTLRFACATSSAIECLPAFRELYPDIEILSQRCNSPKAKEDLIMGRADLGIVLTASLEHTVLEYLPLWTGELLLALPDGHPEVSQEEIHAGNFENSGMITLFSPTPLFCP